jgi:bifunctional DNA-binding transcriptional regulator/antitoxin component of YhaV-PrlF toxin-antitoxin module
VPVEIRRRYGLDAGDEVEFIAEDGRAYLVPLKRRKLSELYGALPVKRRWPGTARARAIVGRKLGEQRAATARRVR